MAPTTSPQANTDQSGLEGQITASIRRSQTGCVCVYSQGSLVFLL